MCNLLVLPDIPSSNPQKDPKVLFDGFCMFFAKFCNKIGKLGRPKVPLAGSYVKQSVVRFCCSFFRNGKGRKKFNHPNVVHVIVPPVKKFVLAAVFIFVGQNVPGCAILVFPGNLPANPQKYPKVAFDCFCMFLQNVAKRIKN